MDFFETREKYRRKEVQVYTSWIIRFFALSLALWLGWQWGSIEQRRSALTLQGYILKGLSLNCTFNDNQALH